MQTRLLLAPASIVLVAMLSVCVAADEPGAAAAGDGGAPAGAKLPPDVATAEPTAEPTAAAAVTATKPEAAAVTDTKPAAAAGVEIAAPLPPVDTAPPAGGKGKAGRLPAPLAPAASPADRERADKPPHGISGLLSKLDLFQGLSVTGQNTFTFQNNSVEGSQTSYESQRWDTGNVVRQSSLHLEGPVWKQFAFQADISDSGYGSSYSRWIAGYVAQDTALLFGDLDLSLAGNEFAGFRKSTKGWQLDQKLVGDGFLRAFYTREKGVTRNETVVGNDTPGPYFLTYTPVIEGSEVVKVNEQYVKFGRDYTLDYDSGQLSFEPIDGQPRIITASDTISISYQSLGYLSQGPEQIYGLRAEWPLLGNRLVVGLTNLQQRSKTAGSLNDTVSYQEDVYNGSGSTGPFDTNFRPIIPNATSVVYKGTRQVIDKPLIVLVDGSEQVETADYDSYRSIGRIIFRRAVPPTSLVIIKYYYDLGTTNASPDHDVVGVDLAYQLSPNTNLALDWASSTGGTSGKHGNALAATVDYTNGPLKLMTEYRNTDPNYSYMDTVGFRRREKGFNLGGEWQISDAITISDRYSSLNSDSGLSFGYSGYSGTSSGDTITTSSTSTSSSLDVETSRNDFAARFGFRGWPELSYQRSSMSNRGGATGASASDYTTDNLQASYSPRGAPYTLRSSLSRSRQESLALVSGEATLSGSTSDQLQTSVTFTPVKSVSLAASFATNASAALETVNTSKSRNLQFTGRWTPSTSLGVEISRTLSRAHGRVTSSYYSTTTTTTSVGSAYSPGGGSSDDGDDDDTDTTTPSSDDQNDRVAINWRPSDQFQLDLSLGRRNYQSTGSTGYLADSNQKTWNLGAMWQTSEALALNLTVGSDNLQFLEAGRGAVRNKSYVFTSTFRPPGKRWGSSLTVNMQDGSSPTYVGYGRLQRYRTVPTKLVDVSGQLSYTLSDAIALQLTTGVSDYAGGYSDFRKNNAELRMRYQLSGVTGLDLGYRVIRNITRNTDDGLIYGTTTSGQNYIASTFLLTLSTSFRGGIGSSRTAGLGGGRGMRGGLSGGPGTFGGYQSGLRSSTAGSGFGGISSGTGYSASRFDAMGSYNLQQGTAETYGSGSPWDSGTGGSTGGSTGGGIGRGIGEFRKTERREQSFGTSAGPGATGGLEDWWLLGDNRAAW